MMISPEQIRAARAMLDWSQDVLAKKSGLSLNTIHSLEKGHLSARSVAEVRRTFENNGFEFYGDNGLARHKTETRSFSGSGSSDKFFEEMLATAKDKGGTIVAIYKTSDLFARSLGITDFNKTDRLEELGKFAKVQCLLSDAHHSSFFTTVCQFRAMPQCQLGPWGTFTCGDKHVIVVTKNGKDFMYCVVNSLGIAQADFQEFEPLWKAAFPFICKPDSEQR